MEQMANAIGKEDDAKRYADLIGKIRSAFQKEYIKDNGEVGTGTQTSYVVALYTKMAPESLEPVLVNNLVKDIESRKWHLSTGFLGTPFLLSTLADHGRADVAYRLLLNDTSILGLHAFKRRNHMVGALERRHRRPRHELL